MRTIQIEKAELLKLIDSQGNECYIKDAARGHSGFQIFTDMDPLQLSTGGCCPKKKIKTYADIVYIGANIEDAFCPDCKKELTSCHCDEW